MSDVARILDANFNRASEGLRVVEEYARFLLEDSCLTSLSKDLRHQLVVAKDRLPIDLPSFRDTPRDVGTTVTNASESLRESAAHVALASYKRVQQALRCLEEYGKVVSTDFAAQVEQLRYRSYTLESAVRRRARDPLVAQLYVLQDLCSDGAAFEKRIVLLTEQGVDVIQLRDKAATDRTLFERTKTAVALTQGTDTLLIVNDRADIAAACRADGVHVGQNELPVAATRAIVGSDLLIGVSTHNAVQVEKAVLDGADYIGCGPTFPSGTKQFEQFAGVEFLQEASQLTTLPAFAIGGITLANLDDVLASGFSRVAVQGCVEHTDDPVAVIAEFKRRLADT